VFDAAGPYLMWAGQGWARLVRSGRWISRWDTSSTFHASASKGGYSCTGTLCTLASLFLEDTVVYIIS
jgi:hypothetical protein